MPWKDGPFSQFLMCVDIVHILSDSHRKFWAAGGKSDFLYGSLAKAQSLHITEQACREHLERECIHG